MFAGLDEIGDSRRIQEPWIDSRGDDGLLVGVDLHNTIVDDDGEIERLQGSDVGDRILDRPQP